MNLADYWNHVTISLGYASLYKVEAALVLAFALVLLLLPFQIRGLPRRLSPLRGAALPPWRTMLALVAVAVAAHWIAMGGFHPQGPAVHDEHSYSLSGDMYASGRLSYPTHPFWQHFETFHVLMTPSYATKYPPGVGLTLALGQKVFGHQVAGMWASAALLAALVYWMLLAYVPPQWALVGGLLALARLGIYSYWANSYWGGMPAAVGSALLFGAAGRLAKHTRPRDGVLLGLGMAAMVLTRPFEGAAVCSVTAAWVAYRWYRGQPAFRRLWVRALAPAVIVIVLTGAWLCYLNYRVTGNPLKAPYTAYEDQYGFYHTFYWEKPRPAKTYRHEPFRYYYYEYDRGGMTGIRGWDDFTLLTWSKAVAFWLFYIGPALTLPLIFFLRDARKRRWRLAVLAVAVCALAIGVVAWRLSPHYAAPLTGPVYLAVVGGLRRMALWRPRRTYIGELLAAGCVLSAFAMPGVRAKAPGWGEKVTALEVVPWYNTYTMHLPERDRVLAELESKPGKHLALVLYQPGHNVHMEWVYNRADIDASKVVWARFPEDKQQRQELIRYYRGRSVWMIWPDIEPVRLFPYDGR